MVWVDVTWFEVELGACSDVTIGDDGEDETDADGNTL